MGRVVQNVSKMTHKKVSMYNLFNSLFVKNKTKKHRYKICIIVIHLLLQFYIKSLAVKIFELP